VVQVFLETQRLVLRRFTVADADDLVSLDADPDVMRFVTGGISTFREEIGNDVLPAFLRYDQRYEGFGFWAAVEKPTGNSLAGFLSGRVRTPSRARSSLVTGCASQLGARGMPPRARAR
jgi:RimJ/RimL family protein N-acetyltransferase